MGFEVAVAVVGVHGLGVGAGVEEAAQCMNQQEAVTSFGKCCTR